METERTSCSDSGAEGRNGGGGFHRRLRLSTPGRGKTKEQNIIRNSRMVNRTTVSTSFQPGSLPGLLTTVAPAVITRTPGGEAGSDKEGQAERE